MITFISRLLWTVCVDRLGHDQVVLIVDSLFIIIEFGCCPCLGIRTIFFYCVEYYIYWNTWVVVDWLFLSLNLREEQKPNHNWLNVIVNYSPVHVIFVHVIFLDSGNFPSFLKFLQSKITCIPLGVSAITLFLQRVTVNLSDYGIEEILLYNSCL